MRILESVRLKSWPKLALSAATYTAIVFGATGATGQHVLRELLESPSYSKVLEAGRRVTAQDKLPASAKDKLEQRTVDFEKLEGLQGYDHVYITCVRYIHIGLASRETYHNPECTQSRYDKEGGRQC